MKRTLVLALSSLSLAACGMKIGGVTIPGGKSSGGGTANGPTSTAPAPAPDAPPSEPVGDLAPYYSSLQLDALYQLINNERQDQIYERAKTAVGRDMLWKSPNPDPAWIREWRQKDWTNASENAEAMTQAAFNRAWESSCVAEYAASKKAHGEITARLAPELARVDALTNYYERMAGYVALAAQVEADLAAAGLPLGKDPFGAVGFRATVATHAIAYHAGSRHAFVGFPGDRFAALDRMEDGTRELTDDDATERAAYCAQVARSGGVKTTPVTAIWDQGHMSARRVAWPTVTGDEAAVRAKLAEATKQTTAQLTWPSPLRLENIAREYGLDAPDGEPKLAGFNGLKITAVKGDTFTASRTDSERFAYACRRTNRIDRIADDGRIIYQENCKYGDREWKLTVTATFAELPPGVTPAIGDVVSFAADVDTDAKKTTKDTASHKATARTMTVSGRHLFSIERDKAKLALW